MRSARIHPFAKQMAAQCRRLSALGFSPGTTGQVSALDGDLLWITPQGVNLNPLQAEQLIPIWPDGALYSPDAFYPPPTLEIHKALYAAQPQAGAIVWARPPQACVWATAQWRNAPEPKQATLTGLETPILLLPAFSPTVPDALADAWAMADSTLIAMANSGLISVGDCLESALNQLELMEACAAIELRAARFISSGSD